MYGTLRRFYRTPIQPQRGSIGHQKGSSEPLYRTFLHRTSPHFSGCLLRLSVLEAQESAVQHDQAGPGDEELSILPLLRAFSDLSNIIHAFTTNWDRPNPNPPQNY